MTLPSHARPAAGAMTSPSPRQVNMLLNNLRGEDFRRSLNAASCRRSVTSTHAGPSLPPMVFSELEPELSIPQPPPLTPQKRTAGPPAPRSWQREPLEQRMRDSPDWRRAALGPFLDVPEKTHRLVHACLRILLESADDETLADLPLHLRQKAARLAAVHSPLSAERLLALLGPMPGEAILARAYPAHILRTVLNAGDGATCEEEAEDAAWDDFRDDPPALESLAVLHTPFSQSVIPLLPPSITRLALLAIPSTFPLHRLPSLLPQLVFLDLSFNDWVTKDALIRVLWPRLRLLETLGLRECAIEGKDRDEVASVVQKRRIDAVRILYC